MNFLQLLCNEVLIFGKDRKIEHLKRGISRLNIIINVWSFAGNWFGTVGMSALFDLSCRGPRCAIVSSKLTLVKMGSQVLAKVWTRLLN